MVVIQDLSSENASLMPSASVNNNGTMKGPARRLLSGFMTSSRGIAVRKLVPVVAV